MKPGDKVVDLRDKWRGIYRKNESPKIALVIWTLVDGRPVFHRDDQMLGVLRRYLCTSDLGHLGNPCIFCEYEEEDHQEPKQ